MTTANDAWEFEAIGTHWSIASAGSLSETDRDAVNSVIREYDRALSRFRPDSTVAALSDSAAPWPGGGRTVTFPGYAAELFDLFDTLHRITGGAVDPTVGTSLSSLGYDSNYSFAVGTPVPAVGWNTVERHRHRLTAHHPVGIDIGAAGKGQLVDLVFDALTGVGHRQLTVDAGGDIRTSVDVLRVGLEHPTLKGNVIGVAELGGQAIAASALTRRTWAPGIHHLLDARTGVPTGSGVPTGTGGSGARRQDTVIATWAVASSAMVADGLATALFFCPPEELTTEFDFEWVCVHGDHSVEYSPEMKEALFLA